MIYHGISKTFSTVNSIQFESIGAFWDEMSQKYGRGNLRGLGYNWTDHSIEYVIGLKEGIIQDANCTIELPDNNWVIVHGRIDDIVKIYDKIYQDGRLIYEIEMFTDNGDCEIQYYR